MNSGASGSTFSLPSILRHRLELAVIRLDTALFVRLAEAGPRGDSGGQAAHPGPSAAERALALLVLLASSPVWLICFLAIRLDSPGPVFFRQTRLGLGGRRFTMLKFRTMQVGADESAHRQHVRSLLRSDPGQPEVAWANLDASDPRITRSGRKLRRWHLDELPQLLNVLAGDMCLVGPRPATAYEAELWSPWHRARLGIRPGITGLWQVVGRGRASFDDMVRLDLIYGRIRSPWLDALILIATPLVAFRSGRRSPSTSTEAAS